MSGYVVITINYIFLLQKVKYIPKALIWLNVYLYLGNFWLVICKFNKK